MDILEINENLAEAHTLRSRFYVDPAFFQTEKEKIFWNTWQPVARLEQLQKPGDFLATDVAGEPVVLLRDNDGTLRAFSNVCRHRGSLIANGCGNTKTLQCPYHAWTYGLDGTLRGAPEFEEAKKWDPSQVSLTRYQVDTWGPFVFVNLGRGTPTLSEMLGNIPAEVGRWGKKLEDYRFLCRRDYVVNCNWKVYVDNYLEGYHLPTVHPQLFRELDYSSYRVDNFDYHISQYAPLRPVKSNVERKYDPAEGSSDALYYWVFPNFMVNVYPDNMSSNIILPLGHDKTFCIFEWFVPEEKWTSDTAAHEAMMAFSDQVQKEDITICERVQVGLQSRSYSHGRYSVKRENGVHHFHRLLQKFIGL